MRNDARLVIHDEEQVAVDSYNGVVEHVAIILSSDEAVGESV